MGQIKPLKRDDFTLKKVKFTFPGLNCDFYEKRVIEDSAETIETNRKSKYNPHPDLVSFKNDLKHYLVKAFHLLEGYDIAEKYLKGEQKQKAIDGKIELLQKVEVTGVSVGGSDELEGIVISGKIESNNGSKCAINTPRIVFSSDKLGYEKEVQSIFELLENEVYKYIFDGKSGEATLFNNPEVPSENPEEAEKKKEKAA